MATKIVVEYAQDPCKRVFHTRLRINIPSVVPITVSNTHNWEGVIGKNICEDLNSRHQVKCFTIDPKRLVVEVEDSVDWGLIQPYVITLLKRMIHKYHKVSAKKIKVSKKYAW